MASVKNSQGAFQADSDVHISFEDQQKINKFARQNAQMEDFKEELKIKRNCLENYEDAFNELALLDDDVKIPYHIGDVFINHDMEKTMKCLEEAKEKKLAEISALNTKRNELRAAMNELKTQLYAKFGSHINLEADQENDADDDFAD